MRVLLCVVVSGLAHIVGPEKAAAQANPSASGQSVLRSGQEAAVLRLLAPWREGQTLPGGIRWAGTRIDSERICFALQTPSAEQGAVCLALAHRAAALLGETPTVPLLADVVAGWQGDAFAAVPPAAITQTIARQIRASATPKSLRGLWSAPKREVTRLAVGGEQTSWQSRTQAALILSALLLVAGWLLLAVRREAASLPGGGWVWTAGLLATSALLRVWLSPVAPMEAWSWSRITAGGELVARLAPLIGLLTPDGVWFGTAESASMLVFASLTPLALFCHASRLFSEPRVAVAGAVLLALSPHHIRFSAAPTQFVPSLLTSSLGFYWLYLTVDAARPAERALRLALLPVWLWFSFSMRPLNLFFAPLMMAVLAIASRTDARVWRSLIGAVVGASALLRFALEHDDYARGAPQKLSHVLMGAAELLFRADWNPLTFWRLTPPVWLPLVAAGALVLLRAPWPSLTPGVARARAVWLLAWLVGFIVLHGVVVVDEPMNNARYQLHSLPAMAMLAGAGLTGLWWRPSAKRWALAALVAVLAAPWLAAPSIGDVDFDVMRERAFLEALRDDPSGVVPSGCQVIELIRTRDGDMTSKLDRTALRIGAAPDRPPRWRRVLLQPEPDADVSPASQRSVSAGLHPPAGLGAPTGAPLILLEDAAEQLRALDGCVALYEGPECATSPGNRDRHPACQALLEAADWEVAKESRFVARVYDQSISQHLHRNGDEVVLRLWRRRGQ